MASRSWLLTIHKAGTCTANLLLELETLSGLPVQDQSTVLNTANINCITAQFEEAKKTKKLHVQLYVQLSAPMRLTGLLERLRLDKDFGHAETHRFGSEEDMATYCQKTSTHVTDTTRLSDWLSTGFEALDIPATILTTTRWSVGTMTKQGQAKGLAILASALAAGTMTRREAIMTDPANYARAHNGLKDILSTMSVPRNSSKDIKISIHWGVSGAGKTRAAEIEARETGKPFYWKNDMTKWWNNYEGEEIIIWDDFTPNDIYCKKTFLKVLDKYPLQVEIKGGYVNMRGLHFIITANTNWRDWWTDDEEDMGKPFRRRVQQFKANIVHYRNPFVQVIALDSDSDVEM